MQYTHLLDIHHPQAPIPKLKGQGRRQLVLLDNINAVLKPGRMTLLLGPPGAGKSILMKTMAGLAPATANVSGEVLVAGGLWLGMGMGMRIVAELNRSHHSSLLWTWTTFNRVNGLRITKPTWSLAFFL